MAAPDAPSPSPVASGPSVEAVGRAITRLGWDLYQQLAGIPGNLFFSPASIFLCLAMLAEGATGAARRALLKAMRLDEDVAGVGEAVRKWMKEAGVGGLAGKNALLVGNSLWVNDRVTLRHEFRDRMAAQLGADIAQCSFADPTAVGHRIDAWILDRTNGMIPGLGMQFPQDTPLIAVNAVFMHGTWSNPFERRDTRPMPFRLDGDTPTSRQVEVPMMFREDDFGYLENQHVQALEMRYSASQRSMVVLLPKDSDDGAAGADALVKEVASHHVRRWWPMGAERLKVFFPKFDLDWSAQLTSALVALGMPPGFAADDCVAFTGVAGSMPLDVAHRAHVIVDEEGTVAAAAAGAHMAAGFLVRIQPSVFRADRPFLFYIADRVTDTVLFLGRVQNPSA
jgi:serpin B